MTSHRYLKLMAVKWEHFTALETSKAVTCLSACQAITHPLAHHSSNNSPISWSASFSMHMEESVPCQCCWSLQEPLVHSSLCLPQDHTSLKEDTKETEEERGDKDRLVSWSSVPLREVGWTLVGWMWRRYCRTH